MARHLLGIVNIFLLLLVGIIAGVYTGVTPDVLEQEASAGSSKPPPSLEFPPPDKKPYAPPLQIEETKEECIIVKGTKTCKTIKRRSSGRRRKLFRSR